MVGSVLVLLHQFILITIIRLHIHIFQLRRIEELVQLVSVVTALHPTQTHITSAQIFHLPVSIVIFTWSAHTLNLLLV